MYSQLSRRPVGMPSLSPSVDRLESSSQLDFFSSFFQILSECKKNM